jgi:pSer/pThr/pTyr-binding forkhead associated (FHA) protein
VLRGAPPAALVLVVPGRAYVAGRAEGCALPLAVEEVSREHAVFSRGAAGVVVRDLGSKNGVLVGGARVAGERPLADGDVVQIGPVALAFEDPVARYLAELEGAAPEGAGAATTATPAAVSFAGAASSSDQPPAAAPPPGAPTRRPRGTPALLVGVAVSVLVLLAVAAGVLLFGGAS